jgi:hypothetical protein
METVVILAPAVAKALRDGVRGAVVEHIARLLRNYHGRLTPIKRHFDRESELSNYFILDGVDASDLPKVVDSIREADGVSDVYIKPGATPASPPQNQRN